MKHLKDIVQEYINNDNRETAMMINGEWGSGKTYFVKNTLIPELKDPKSPNIIYVSLNGLNSIGEIPERILMQCFGDIEKKGSKKIFRDIKNTASTIISNINLGGLGNTILQLTPVFSSIILSNKLKNTIIFVDDLERISSDLHIADVLGYMCTNYIEDCKAKIVFICNEKEIEESDRYNSIKEKTISFTVEFKPILKELIDSFFTKEQYNTNSVMKKYYNSNKDQICELFNRLDIKNLRTVQAIVDVFNVTTLPMKGSGEELLEKIFLFIVAIQNEYAIGNLPSKNEEMMRWLRRKTESYSEMIYLDGIYTGETQGKKDFDQFIYKYCKGNKFLWRFFESIYNYQISRYMDKNLFKEEIATFRQKPKPALAASNKFMSIWKLETKEEVEEVITELNKHIDDGHYNVDELRNIYNNLHYVKNVKMFSNLINSLESSVIMGIEDILQKSQTPNELHSTYQDIFHFARDDDHIAELKDLFQDIYSKTFKVTSKRLCLDFLEALEGENGKYTKARELIRENNIFKMIVDLELTDKIVNLSNKAIWDLRVILPTDMTHVKNHHFYDKQDIIDAVNVVVDTLEQNLSDNEWKKYNQTLLVNQIKRNISKNK